MKQLNLIAVVIALTASGCERPSLTNIFVTQEQREQEKLAKVLEVKVVPIGFNLALSVRNVGDDPITIRKVTINNKYVPEYWPTQLGTRGGKFEPKEIEMGESAFLWLDYKLPRPEKIVVETDQGQIDLRMTYE